jgi:hypothetical protein
MLVPSSVALRAASLAALASSLSLAACAGDPPSNGPAAPTAEAEPHALAAAEAPAAEAPAARAKLAATKFGQPVSAGDTTELSAIAADPAKFAGKSVKTEGVVKAVCKKAGCWMEIESDEPGGDRGAAGRAHVKMAGHAFFVPKNCDGHRAVVEGTVKAGPPEDTCSSKDACGGSENGAVALLEIAATGVEFVD